MLESTETNSAPGATIEKKLSFVEAHLVSEVTHKKKLLQTDAARLREELDYIPDAVRDSDIRDRMALAVQLIQSTLRSQVERKNLWGTSGSAPQNPEQNLAYLLKDLEQCDYTVTAENAGLFQVLLELVSSARALIRDHMKKNGISWKSPAEQGFKIRLPQNRIAEDGSVEPTGNPIVAD